MRAVGIKQSKLYRTWADTWWRQREVPLWVRKMKGWQRVIFRHQYGETFFRFADLNGRMRQAGASVGVETVLAFGWWQAGMDNGYPDSYWVTDPAQGGDPGWAEAIANYRKQGGRLMLYFNGKLIDCESHFYRHGEGKSICYHDNTGADYTEQYRFKGLGTFTGYYNARTFAVADTRREPLAQAAAADGGPRDPVRGGQRVLRSVGLWRGGLELGSQRRVSDSRTRG